MSKHASASEAADESVTLETGLEALKSSPEFRGPVEPLHDHNHTNDHFALIYESQEEQFAAAIPFIQQGLERGERCLYITHENSREEVVAAMRAYGVDVDAVLDSGALSIHDEEETYLRNGTFDADDTIEFLDTAIEEASEEYETLRVTGEMSGILPEDPEAEKLVRCEAKANYLFDDVDGIALCQYNRERFSSDVIRDVISTHPLLIHDNRISYNVYYTPPEEFIGPDKSDNEVDRLLNGLKEQTDTKTELQQREQYLRESYEITSASDLGFEEKLQSLFELGRKRFGLDLGGLARVDPESDLFEVEAVSGDHDHLVPGARVDLSETHCRVFADEKSDAVANPGGITDSSANGFETATSVTEFGVQAYLGTRVPVDNGLDRTLFFISQESRDDGFSDAERTFHRLIGQWVKYELERNQREQELRKRKQHQSALVDTTPECIKTVADDGTLLQMNPAGLDMVEAEAASDVIGLCVYDLIAPEHREKFREFNERICRGESGTLEFDIIGLEGTRRHMESHAAPLHHPDGTMSHVALTRDVTEQVEREAELRQTKNRFETVFEQTDDAIFLTDPETDDYIDVNPVACEELGYTRDELLSMGPSDLHPGEMDQFRAFVDAVQEDGSAWTEDLHCRTKDGRDLPAEVTASTITLDGRDLVLANVRHIEERKKHERYQRELYDAFADPQASFDEKIEDLLELGRERFGLDIGYFTRTDDDDTFEIVKAVGDHDDIQSGVSATLSDTYCEKLLASPGPISVQDAAEVGWVDDPAYDQFGLDAFFAMTVRVGGEEHGTLCFASESPRRVPFSDAERTFLNLMGQLVEYELERQRREQFLRESYQITADPALDFEEKLGQLLDLGREWMGLDAAGLTHLPSRDGEFLNEYTVGYGTDEDGEVWTNPGEGCYCRETITSDEPVGMADVRDTEWADDEIHQDHGLTCYLGTKVTCGSTPYGTLWVGSTEPRIREFTETERTFLELIGQWVSYEIERREHNESLRKLYDISSDPDLKFEEKFERILELGCERFGLEIAALNHLPTWDGEFRLETSVGLGVGPDEELRTNPNSGCFCRRTITEDEPVEVADVRDTRWIEDTIYQEFEITSYLGTKVSTGSTPYGTLWFGSTEPRTEPFSDAERSFIELIGQWVSYEIEQRDHEHFQRKLYEITADPELDTDEKIGRLLEVGCDRLGLPVGMLNRDQGAALEVQQMQGEHPALCEGAYTPPSSDHYCREVVDTGTPLTIIDAEVAGCGGDPLYEDIGLETYAGMPVTVGDNIYGTLCFADTSPRQTPFTESEQAFLDLLGQCVSYELDRSHREGRLHMLNSTGRKLLDAETNTEIAEGVVDTIKESFETPLAAVALYDEETGELRPAAHTESAAELLEKAELFDGPDGDGWNAFIENETKWLSDPLDQGGADASDEPSQPPISEAVVHPLDNHGVYIVGTRRPNGFWRGDAEAIETGAANIRAALDRTDREHKLQDREQTLEEQNETLERLNRINDTIRRLDQALVEASTRDEIERVVCEELASSGPYELAWIGNDSVGDEVTPTEWAGAEKGYLDQITISSDNQPEGNGPTGRAIKTGEPQVVNNVLQDESFEPWRQDALNRGYHATAAFPLTYDHTQYGVLNIYAGQPEVFDSLEREVLAELSDTVGYAINAIESKKALVSDEVTELEFTVEDSNLEVVELARELECTFSMERLVPESDGSMRAFFSVYGAPAADVLEFEPNLPATDLRLISDGDDGSPSLFEVTLTEESLSRTTLDHGGRLQAVQVEDGTATVVVHLAAEADVREFTQMFQSKYPNSELRAQRREDQPQQTALEFVAALLEDLTSRQEEALQMAYFNGYFEEPRMQTASDIAASMDISQPTFNSHLRTAMRKLCRRIYEDDPATA